MITRGVIRNIGAVEDAAYTIVGSNPYGVAVFLHNIGQNNIVYKFQKSIENIESSFVDLVPDVDGFSAIADTMEPDDVRSLLITATSPFLRIVASANGGSVLSSSVVQFSKNSSNILPILNI